MNNVLNEFKLLGRLTSDPEYKTMQGKNGEVNNLPLVEVEASKISDDSAEILSYSCFTD